MKKPTPYEETVIARWKERIKDRAAEIDVNGQYDWHDLCMGFFLGSGFESDRAWELVTWTTQRGFL